MKRLLLLVAAAGSLAWAQEDRPVRYFPNDPPGGQGGGCSVITPLWNNWVAGKLFQCVGGSGVNMGTWRIIALAQPNTLLTGSVNYFPIINQAANMGGFLLEPTITTGNTSILFAHYIEQTNPAKISSNTFLNGLGVNMYSSNAQPNQNAAVLGFWYSLGGADPFGGDLHGIVPSNATATPNYVIGVQGTAQQDSIPHAAAVFSTAVLANCASNASPPVPCNANFWATGTGANFVMNTDGTSMIREGIVLTPADDLNTAFRAFGVVNHSNSQNNGYIAKSGLGFFRGGIEVPAGINYATETGGSANNAIVADLVALDTISLGNGMCVYVPLAHSLQAGADTLNINSTGAIAIKSHFNVTSNIGTAYVIAGASAPAGHFCYNGAVWLDMSQ